MNNFTLEKSVMRRVYLMWMGRLIVNRYTIKVALLVLFLWLFASFVFVAAVMQNASHAAGMNYLGYFFGAFLHTQLVTQAVVLGITVVAALLVADTVRNLRYARFLGRRA